MSKAYAVTEFEKASRKKIGANSTYRGQPKTASYTLGITLLSRAAKCGKSISGEISVQCRLAKCQLIASIDLGSVWYW